MSDESDGFGLAHRFMNQSEDYVLGFEAGQIWAMVAGLDDGFERTVHERNKAEILRIAAHFDRPLLRWEPLGEGFAVCEVGPMPNNPVLRGKP